MIYKQVSTSALKELHQSIQRCLSEDDNTPSGQMKPYGVREFNDWSEHLNEIEAELSNKGESYTPIGIKISGAVQRPTPVEFVLYEKIKSRLAAEDSLPSGANKAYGVREFPDWKQQADSFEKALDNLNYPYTKIIW
jgi:hypothetical protein